MNSLRTLVGFSVALGCITASSLAVAQAPASSSPRFATLDRIDDRSSAIADLTLAFFDNDFSDATGVGLTLHGNVFFTPNLGGFATIPFSRIIADNVDDESALGGIELGVLYTPKMNGPTSMIIRGGLVLPTADEDGTALFTGLARITDLIYGVPDYTSLRLSASLKGRSGQMFWRFDGGLDVPFYTGEGEEPSDFDPLIRLNVAAGFDAGAVAIAAELVNLGTTGDIATNNDRFIHTVGLSATLRSSGVEPMIAISVPLGNDFDSFIDYSIIAGLTVPIESTNR